MHNTNNFCDFAERHKNANTNRSAFPGTFPASFAYFWKFSEPIKDNWGRGGGFPTSDNLIVAMPRFCKILVPKSSSLYISDIEKFPQL